MIYLIGALRNLRVQEVAHELRANLGGEEVFDDWASPGEEADEKWQAYERRRGRTYRQALDGWHAQHVFHFDKTHLDRARAAVLLQPAGKSAHLELGYIIGQGKPGYILYLAEPERFDIMMLFATEVFTDVYHLIEALRRLPQERTPNDERTS